MPDTSVDAACSCQCSRSWASVVRARWLASSIVAMSLFLATTKIIGSISRHAEHHRLNLTPGPVHHRGHVVSQAGDRQPGEGVGVGDEAGDPALGFLGV